MSKSVAAPQTELAPSSSQDLAPQQSTDIPWGLLMSMGASTGVMAGQALGLGAAMGMSWLRDKMGSDQATGEAAAGPTLQERYDAATDPNEKLALWGELHKADAAAAMGDREETHWYDWSDEDAARAHRNQIKDETLSATHAEVDDEIRALQAQHAKDGTPLTMEEIDALAARKSLELKIEQNYGVNLTNAMGATDEERADDPAAAAQKDAARRTWSVDELTQADQTFSRMNPTNVRDNAELREYRREAQDSVSGTRKGAYDNGVISVYDRANQRPQDQSGGPTANGAPGGVADTLAQKTAEAIKAQDPEAYERFKEAATADGSSLQDNLPTVTDEHGEDTWKDAKYSVDAAWQNMYSKWLFSPERAHEELIGAPTAAIEQGQRGLQTGMLDKLTASRAGDGAGVIAQEQANAMDAAILHQQEAAQGRRDSMFESLISAL